MERGEFATMELVRRIRDAQYEALKDKSDAEVQAFFHQQAALATAEAERLRWKRAGDAEPAHQGATSEPTE